MSDPVFSFFEVQTREQALARLAVFSRLPGEQVALAEAHGRVLARAIQSPEALPAFRRSTMDGFAVAAKDLFGASESAPALLEVVGEIAMGEPARLSLRPGQAARIWTGGMLPEGADAVVMLEYSRDVDGRRIELTRALAPGNNVIEVGEDVGCDELVLPAGRSLRAQELGLLGALGITRVDVVRQPRVAIISTGNELVPAEAAPAPGQIRDVNTHTLSALVREAGAIPIPLGLVGDDPARLRDAVESALREADVALVSGGSSVGAADWTLRTFLSFPGAELLVHGVAIKPGKPVIVVRVGERALIGLPGHVASTLVTFELIVRPLVRARLLAAAGAPGRRVPAILQRNVPASPGRETWFAVQLEERAEGLVAKPLLGASGVMAPLVQAHGLVCVPLGVEGLLAGAITDVHLF